MDGRRAIALDGDALVLWIQYLIQHDQLIKFYNSAIWRRLRQEVLNEQHNECQMCRDKGIAEQATVAHHVKHVRQHPSLAMTKSNLLCLCSECHYQLHHTIAYKVQLNVERW